MRMHTVCGLSPPIRQILAVGVEGLGLETVGIGLAGGRCRGGGAWVRDGGGTMSRVSKVAALRGRRGRRAALRRGGMARLQRMAASTSRTAGSLPNRRDRRRSCNHEIADDRRSRVAGEYRQAERTP